MSVARDTVAGLRVRRSPDTTLLDHALRGDAVAFSEIHRRYSGRVFAFCLARLMSVDAAQDATQEVFLRLLSADPDQVRSISGWLFGVARHACIDIARARNRTVPTEAETIEGELGALAAGRSAEEQMLSQAQANDVFLALRRMKPRYRSVLVLRELHGQSMAEIAEALSVNMGAAYTLLSRARDAFGKAYAGTHDLPSQCREAVELVYRETGSGISEAQSEKLQAHLAECSNCSREARYAKDRPLFAGLLPLLPLSWGTSAGLLGRALARLGGAAPSLGAASPAVPAVAPWAPAAVATALSAAVVLGSVVAPSGLASQGGAERARAAVAPTAISSPAVTAGTGGAPAKPAASPKSSGRCCCTGTRGGSAARPPPARPEAAVARGSGGQARGTTTPGMPKSTTRATTGTGAGTSGATAGSTKSSTAKSPIDSGPAESAKKQSSSAPAAAPEAGDPAGPETGSAAGEALRLGAAPK